jgi:acetyl esterase/lipase
MIHRRPRIADARLSPAMLGAWLVAAAMPNAVSAQGTGRGLVVPVPPLSQVTVTADSFTTSTGTRRRFDVYRPGAASRRVPVVVFANGSGPDLLNWNAYQGWARLVTSRGAAGVLYEGPVPDRARTPGENNVTSGADLDSVLKRLADRSGDFGIDGDNVVIWAASAQTGTGTPVALTGNRPAIRGYVLYYGAGSAPNPRLDVPVFVARAGLDSPELNRDLDSLVTGLSRAGTHVTLVTYPAGQHGFDILDSTAVTARIIDQTLDFIESATNPEVQRAISLAIPEVRASTAYVGRRWAEAAQLYSELQRAQPTSRSIAWKLGLSQLEAGQYSAALDAFAKARDLGVTGARDIGLPAARAGVRGRMTDRAAEWVAWAIRQFPRIRAEIAADRELAPLLEHPLVKGG